MPTGQEKDIQPPAGVTQTTARQRKRERQNERAAEIKRKDQANEAVLREQYQMRLRALRDKRTGEAQRKRTALSESLGIGKADQAPLGSVLDKLGLPPGKERTIIEEAARNGKIKTIEDIYAIVATMVDSASAQRGITTGKGHQK